MRQLLQLFQEIFGSTSRAQRTAESGVYSHAAWYIALKVLVVGGAGTALCISAFRPGADRSPFEISAFAAAGIGLLGVAVAIWRGPRRITVSNGLLTAEFPGGRTEQHLLRDLIVTAPPSWKYIGPAVSVRSRRTGVVVLVIPRDLPGWEVLVSEIEASGAA